MQNTQSIVGRSESVSHDQIAALARTLWEQEGRPAGRDLEHWFKAEAQLFSSTMKQVPALNTIVASADKPISSKKRTRSAVSK